MQEARLNVSRLAAGLFWKRGFEATSGDDIAAAAGLSKRTIWRYFRSKEACVEPLFLATGYRFVEVLRVWPRDLSLEALLPTAVQSMFRTKKEIRDATAAARLVSRFEQEPALRSAYLMAGAQAERALADVIAARLNRDPGDAEVRLSAAAASAAIRVVDEEVCSAAINHGKQFEAEEISARLAAAIRATNNLPICDPVRV